MPRNVLFILADQFRADCLGSAGNHLVKTPNLDRLAAAGVRFANCFNQTAPCGPSRMSIYTSRYLCSTRAINNMTPLRDAEENWGYALRQAGYDPGLVGYNDYGVDPAIFPEGDRRKTSLAYDNVLPGFERVYYHEYDSEEYFAFLKEQGYADELLNHDAIHSPDVPEDGPGEHLACSYPAKYKAEHSECRYVTERALDYIRAKNGGEQGWVLSLNYIKPHPPNINCEPYSSMFDPQDMPTPTRRPEELNHAHPYIRGATGEGQHRDERHAQEFRACYYGMIAELDDNLGLLFDELEKSGAWDDTLIVFSADHGEQLGDHYLVGKGHFYDGAMHIPCIVRDPDKNSDATRGQTVASFVESVDLAPTVLQWLGVEKSDRFQGQSLMGALRGAADYQGKSEIHYEFDYRSGARQVEPDTGMDQHLLWVLRDARYKYVQFADARMPPLLFDLENDPGEFDNLAESVQYAGVVLDCCQRLLRWRMYHEDQRMEHWAAQYRY
ncbi:MAG: sulfatase-like hydrolase/transferase [Candidatus Latescibacterota bacterium]